MIQDVKILMEKYGIPENIKGTINIENLESNKVSFLYNPEYKGFVKPNAGAYILTSKEIFEQINGVPGNKYIIVDDVYAKFAEFHNAFHKDYRPMHTGNGKPAVGSGCMIDSSVKFGQNVKIEDNVTILPYVTIGSDVIIGNNTIIHPSANIFDNVYIGKNCIIDSGAAIGPEGFSTFYNSEFGTGRIKNIGGVRIGDFVEIGCNTVIDRSSFQCTMIWNRVKIDNLVHIAHNCEIGEDTRITPLVCIAGSCKIGKRVWIGIGCSLRDHITVGNDSQVLMNGVLINSIGEKERVGGFYAMPHKIWKKHVQEIREKYKDDV
jgi:UDP-3-O-[3-hydroxymyristoyl] glucosamine N-acyltransferase